MTTLNVTAILKQNRLRLTNGRKEILEVLQRSKGALSHSELDKKLPAHLDRITTYRTLLSFKKKGLIHSIVDPQSGAVRYLINDPAIPKHHAHFKCTGCNLLICLQIAIHQTDIKPLPTGFQAMGYTFVIEGLCDKCLR